MRGDTNAIYALIQDVGGAQKAARLLGVHHSTVYRWQRGRQAMPQAAYRALHAASRWGREDRAVYSRNGKQTHLALIEAQRAEIRELQRRLGKLMALADFGAANRPLFQLVRAT
jgi:IS30 family transposase